MQARLSAVQQALIAVTVSALAIAVLVHPAPNNAEYRRAESELISLQKRFDRHGVETALLAQAKAQGQRSLASLAQQVSALSPVAVHAADPAARIEPLVQVQIGTLEDIEHFSRAGVSVPMSIADGSSVAGSLAWRLARDLPSTAATSSVLIRSAQLQAASVTEPAVAIETEVFQLQTNKHALATAASGASTRLTDLERLYEARVKWHVPRQLRNDTYKSLLEAKKASRDAQRALKDADKRYESAVASATTMAQKVNAHALPGLEHEVAPDRGVMVLDVEGPTGLKHYNIPVRLRTTRAVLPPLQGVALRETRAAGVWDEVKGLDLTQATQVVHQHFNWHNRDIELAGLHIGGSIVLQIVPCVLPFLLWFLLTRMRAVSLDYNPFRTRVKSALPKVGFASRSLDALAIVVLPLVAAVFATASLLYVGAIPVLPLLAAVAIVLLGYFTYVQLGEVQRLMEEVVRSHSVPPKGSDLPEAT